MSEDLQTISHPVYTRSTPEEADGCAWAFLTKDVFDKYYFKLPELQDHEVRIRNMYAGLCHSDVLTARDLWGGGNPRPVVPGHEVAGEVIAVGKNVHKFKVGDKVVIGPVRDSCKKCEYCLSGSTQLCQKTEGHEKYLYGLYFGGYASHLQHPESHFYKLPDTIDIKEVAPLLCAGVTVFSPMSLHLKKGMRIGVLGVGGLGHLAVQIGHKMEMQVDAFVSGTKDPQKNEFLTKLGATNIVLWKQPGVLESVAGLYDAIVCTIPVALDRKTMDKMLSTLKPRGKYIVLGAPPVDEFLSVDFFSIITNEIGIIGSCVGGNKETQEMLDFCACHDVHSMNEHFTWEEFPKALDKLENGTPKFRCVVNVDDFSKNFGTKH